MNFISIFKKSSVIERLVFILLFIFLLVYLILRATLIPMVHDETMTFFHYVHSQRFIPYFSDWDANNHILNSFLSCISDLIFGSTPLALRLPNVLSFIVFTYFIVLISDELKNKLLRNVFVLTLGGF